MRIFVQYNEEGFIGSTVMGESAPNCANQMEVNGDFDLSGIDNIADIPPEAFVLPAVEDAPEKIDMLTIVGAENADIIADPVLDI